MPVYEYKCKDCGEAFEVIQKVNDPPKTACDKCNGELYKVISSSGLVFKGSGWYVTDYSNKLKEPKKDGGDTDSKPKETKAAETASANAQTVK